MPDLVDPTLALRWLGVARRGTLAAQVLLMVAAEAGTQLHLHTPALLGVVGAWATLDVVQVFRARRGALGPRTVLVQAAVDLGALTAILALSGGPHNPLLFAYLAWLALLAMVLPAGQAWAAAAIAVVLEASVVLHPAATGGFAPEEVTASHLASHVVTFDVSAAAITWVVTRLSAALRQRDAEEREVQRRRAVTDRLAALGTLAAGVAHELGTPLGAIQLLAEQAARRAPEAVGPLTTLQEQVARCRSILDRLRGRDVTHDADCELDIARWVDEWQRAAPDVEVQMAAAPRYRVAGSEASWRAALWVALDNARNAGARRVRVRLQEGVQTLELALEDDGRGLDEEAARHVGEPFWTGTGGTGLGLFVARSFAQSVGGDVVVEPGSTGGARTRILFPRVAG